MAAWRLIIITTTEARSWTQLHAQPVAVSIHSVSLASVLRSVPITYSVVLPVIVAFVLASLYFGTLTLKLHCILEASWNKSNESAHPVHKKIAEAVVN
jgi:hypothetical protein